jgi:uncharacterized membrane protein
MELKEMLTFLKIYAAVLATFLIIDAVWISMFVRKYYRQELGDLMRDSPNFVAAGIFYLFYAAGVVLLAINPAVSSGHLRVALVNGAVLGALAYGTYTITNFSIIRSWSLGLVGSDILWGAFLTALVAGVGYWVAIR